MVDTLRAALPAVYQAGLPSFFDSPAPREEKATCNDCVMCPKGEPQPGAMHFRPDTKCCTFHPTLPNYLVGALLSDEDPGLLDGQRRLRERIGGRLGVTPMWLAAPRKFMLLLDAARDTSFGRSKSLLCPYYASDSGLCTIWKHRESACTTFFCRYTTGADGLAFWKSFEQWLRHAERSLAHHAVQTVARDLVEPRVARGALTLEDLEDRSPPPDVYAGFWGSWAGREEDFYVACHRAVVDLGSEGFARLVGTPVGAELLETVRERYEAAMHPRLAERLVMNPELRVQPAEDGVIASTYTTYEPVHLNEQLYEVLREFRAGESVADVRARLERDHGVDVPEELLLTLQQLRILVGA